MVYSASIKLQMTFSLPLQKYDVCYPKQGWMVHTSRAPIGSVLKRNTSSASNWVHYLQLNRNLAAKGWGSMQFVFKSALNEVLQSGVSPIEV